MLMRRVLVRVCLAVLVFSGSAPGTEAESESGVGMLLTGREGTVAVALLYSGFPAEEAGMQVADRIVAIDGRSTEGFSPDDAAELIRGRTGTSVRIAVEREGDDEPLEFEVVRKAITLPDMLYPARQGDEWGYIDKTGRMVIAPAFDRAGDLLEGLARVRVGDKWGYIDKTGRMVIAPRFDDAHDFSEGLAAAKIDGKWGYVDKIGLMAIQPSFTDAADYRNGLARVWMGDRIIYIDNTGSPVWVEE